MYVDQINTIQNIPYTRKKFDIKNTSLFDSNNFDAYNTNSQNFKIYFYSTWNLKEEISPIPASITSPLSTGPTPEGVPVKMTSPSSNVKYLLI